MRGRKEVDGEVVKWSWDRTKGSDSNEVQLRPDSVFKLHMGAAYWCDAAIKKAPTG